MTGPTNLRDIVKPLIARTFVRWTALILVAGAIIGTALYNYREINNELTAVTLARREAVAQLAAAMLQEKFGRLVDIGISLASRHRVQDLVAEKEWVKAIEFLRDVPRELPHIERLFLADTGGTLMADVPELPAVRGESFSHREWYQGISRVWQPYVSPVYTRAAVPRLKVFAVAVPVKNAAARATGILVLQIRIERLLDWVEAADFGPEGFIYFVDSKGQVAFHSRHPDQGEIADVSEAPVVTRLRDGKHGVEIGFDPVEREDSIVASAPVRGYGWGVVVQQPTRASLGLAARDDQIRRLLTGYGFVLLLSTMSIFMASRIAVELRRAEDDRRMKAELERRVAERTIQLDAANKELEAFSYSVSHDLRAPLRSIDGFSQALLEDYADRLDGPGRQHLGRVRAATQRMGELIDDMLQLSRVTRAEIRRETVDLNALAESVMTELRRDGPQRQVEVVIQQGLQAEGDPKLLRIALANLLANAWKFTSRKPAARIELGVLNNGDERAFYVRDNGVGFDMTYAHKLFGAFQRLHAQDEFPGTGIGLATVQRIINRHGGRVWAEAAVNQGATFYFSLSPNRNA